MSHPKANGGRKGGRNGLVAVAIDKEKSSQSALKWAVENLLVKGQTVILIHVLHKTSLSSSNSISDVSSAESPHRQHLERLTKDVFLTFRCFCTCKDVQCFDVVLEDPDIVRALTEYVSNAAIENLVLGCSSRHGFIRKFKPDIPGSVSKGAPDFCTVYVISKGKISSVRNASRPAPFTSPLTHQIQILNERNDDIFDTQSRQSMKLLRDRTSFKPRRSVEESFRSPILRGPRGIPVKTLMDFSESDTDISFISSERPSTDRTSSVGFDFTDSGRTPRLSTSSEHSFGSIRVGPRFMDLGSLNEHSTISQESGSTSCSCSSQGLDEVEAEMKRLKLELKQTMDLYSNACREALKAKQKASEMQHLKLEEEKRLEEARLKGEVALSVAEKERARCQEAAEAAEAAQKIAESEAQRRLNAEMKALQEAEEMKKLIDSLAKKDIRYRRYNIDDIVAATEDFSDSRKIGEGGYGPVYKCYLDHTPVAVKVLRPDAAQGRSQFQQEIAVLSCIRHPNMVLLLGACPEYGILVYEYMAKGSLEDCLFHKGNTPALSWQQRFRIAAEIATGLLFLHQAKPEPIVHRDLKPGNILLDYNYVSKISDVGLARLVPVIAENVTQCRMTSTAGTFCYIDPEYQQTGMLGVKSDVYSLGIMLLQVITAKPAMGLTHHVEQAIEKGKFAEMLDPAVPDWPVEQALCFAKLALQCAELRRKDRPDLGKEVLPELNRLREFSEEKMTHNFLGGSAAPPPFQGRTSSLQDLLSETDEVNSGSSKTQSSSSSHPEIQTGVD
ncbi:U-box domain-containing protein 35-like [Tripterygium wilfordii]|uniref:U-box domain-containing protein 35-like n=1 Tax=Tripterygium wilfordii TaxID=458696 RepID=UPI0018F7FAD3|nr:U-box domain-containing protein 35-like [Tripterygium wilfordii]